MAGRADQSEYCAHPGHYGQVWFAQQEDGTYPAKEFWDGLTEKQRAGFSVLFQTITSNTRLQLFNHQFFNQIKDDLWEFKRNNFQMRIFCFRRGTIWYLVCGIGGKKEDQIKPGDVKRAIEMKESAQRKLDASATKRPVSGRGGR